MTDSDGNCDLLGSRQVISCTGLSFLRILGVSFCFQLKSCHNSSYQLTLDTHPDPLQDSFLLPLPPSPFSLPF